MSRPNIVFITCHDLGKHAGCYGAETVHTPTLDAIAAQGVRFDSHFATSPTCCPSRSSLHTGRHAHANGMLGMAHPPFNWRLHPDERHIAQRLHEAGYTTALVGLQHLTDEPHDLGYETVTEGSGRRMSAEEVGSAAADFLRSRSNAEQPFYLEAGFFEPHRPYHAFGTQPDESKGVSLPPFAPDSDAARRDFAALQGAIRALDDGLAHIWRALNDTGLLENTWLIVTTDHGLAMPRAKSTLFDAGLETLLLMCWKDAGLSGGRCIDALTSHVDIAPTIYEALGLNIAANLHGRSLWPLLTDGADGPNAVIFGEKTFHTGYEPMRCIRTRTHKLIAYFESGPDYDPPADVATGALYSELMSANVTSKRPKLALYDLVSDPTETRNLIGQPEFAAVEATLRQQLADWMRDTGDPLLDGPVASTFYRATLTQLLGDDPTA